jgi:hypothetical protein
MGAIIDLGSELLIDQTKATTPEMLSLLAAIGQPLADGSPWVAVAKCVAANFPFPPAIFGQCRRKSAQLNFTEYLLRPIEISFPRGRAA